MLKETKRKFKLERDLLKTVSCLLKELFLQKDGLQNFI